MTKFREKAQAKTKQIIGEMVGDSQLVQEGKEQERNAEDEPKASDRHTDPHRRVTRQVGSNESPQGTKFWPRGYHFDRRFEPFVPFFCSRCRRWMPKPRSAGHHLRKRGRPSGPPRRIGLVRPTTNRRQRRPRCGIGCATIGSSRQ